MNPPDVTAEPLLELVRELGSELHPARRISVTLDSALDRDIGLDSLGRVELILRMERRFGVNLPEGTLVNAETPRDLLKALVFARPSAGADAGMPLPSVARADSTAMPEHARTMVEALDWHLEAHPQRVHITLTGESGAAAI